jgi:hypothetical protein
MSAFTPEERIENRSSSAANEGLELDPGMIQY